jgi:hypothetical protein
MHNPKGKPMVYENIKNDPKRFFDRVPLDPWSMLFFGSDIHGANRYDNLLIQWILYENRSSYLIIFILLVRPKLRAWEVS